MKCLEGKQNLIEERDKKQCITMDLAMKEAQFKGSLLDRISWLEQRLHKVIHTPIFFFSSFFFSKFCQSMFLLHMV